MSQMAGQENNGGQGPVNINGDGGTAFGGNSTPYGQLYQQQPAPQPTGSAPYQQYVDRFPEPVRAQAESIFKEWDANYTRNTQQYADQLRQYQPYQQFVGMDPQALNMAVQLAQMVQNPQGQQQVFEMLAQELGFDLEDELDENYNGGQNNEDPRLAALENGLSQLTELIQGNQAQTQEEQQADQVLNYLQEVEATNGALDWDYVLTKADATGDLDGAIREYYQNYYRPEFEQNRQQQQQAPVFNPNYQQNGNGQNNGQANGQPMVEVGGIMVPANHPAASSAPPAPLGNGGGLPSNQVDLGKLDRNGRIAMAAQVIAAANQQNQGS